MEIRGQTIIDGKITASDCAFLKKMDAIYNKPIGAERGGYRDSDLYVKENNKLQKLANKVGLNAKEIQDDSLRRGSIFHASSQLCCLVIKKITY